MFKHTKRSSLLAVVALAALMVLAACGGTSPAATEPTAAATAAPVETAVAAEPAVEPTATPVATEEPTAEPEPPSVPPPSEELLHLRSGEWQWIAYAGPMEAYEIDTPGNYRVTFNDDATFSAVADCNNLAGSYIPTDGGEITITPGPMTLAACPEGSRSDQFVAFLGSATRYASDGDNLVLELLADGGTMTFAPAGEVVMDESPTTEDQTAVLAQTLGNLSYTGIVPNQAITLTDGVATYDDGSSGTPIVTLAENLIPATDLDGDGTLDAVALLRDESTGSGTFYFLSAVLDALNNPTPTEALMIGDRIQVKSLMAEGASVLGEIIAAAESDPACCGTWLFNKVYALQDGRLAETGSEQVSQISSTNIAGNWSLVDLNAGQEPVLPEAPITLELFGERVSGSAGCNTYTGTFTSSEEQLNGFTIGDLATTMKLCEQPVMDQEALYLSRLAASTSWGYDFGRLSLIYMLEDETFGTLLFVPQEQ